MVKVLAVGLLADSRSPGGDQFGCLRTDQLLALGHIPWRLACHSDVDVHPVLGRLAFRHLRNPMAGPTPSGSMMEAPSGSSYPGSATYPSAVAQNAAIPCGSDASQPSVQRVAMPERYRRALIGVSAPIAACPGVHAQWARLDATAPLFWTMDGASVSAFAPTFKDQIKVHGDRA